MTNIIKLFIAFIFGFTSYGILAICQNSAYSINENLDKYNYDSPFFKTYVLLQIKLGNCDIINEKNYALIQESPINHGPLVLDELIYNSQHCSVLANDTQFLINLKNNQLSFPVSNEKEQVLLARKYWFFINRDNLFNITNKWVSPEGIFIRNNIRNIY
jgi:hypothetical protein